MVLIEAMACSLPVIAFNCENGPRSIISDGETGLLVPLNDVNMLAEKMMLLIQNEELYKKLSENGKIKSGDFSIEKVVHLWQRLFDELMMQKR